ncbi:MAG: hypothetical protein VYC17_06100 [Nitrospinota bacterium]|nr:hypothetical protein [Nitrospinota bacterium]
MLIFQKNIYEINGLSINNSPVEPADFVPEYHLSFNALHFIESALLEDESLIETLKKQHTDFREEDTMRFYPNAHKVGRLDVMRNIIQIVLQGLTDESGWYHMNTYHFCVLYDVLYRFAYYYNRDSLLEKHKALPDLMGAFLPFDLFLKDYFFNTVFLLDKDTYNSLTAEEKRQRGLTCPRLFGVINGLLPTPEEIELQESTDYPYTVYV